MGVRKFRSVADLPGPPPLPRLDPENLRIACGLSSLAGWLGAVRPRPGVRKYGSWDQLQAARDADQAAAAKARRR